MLIRFLLADKIRKREELMRELKYVSYSHHIILFESKIKFI